MSFMALDTDTARNAAGAAVRTYFNSLSTYMLTTWSLAINPVVQEFDMATGDLIAEATMSSPPLGVVGAQTGVNWAAGSGFFVGWRTAVIFNGRRIQGRTFHVPAVGCFDTDGTLTAGALTAIGSAADALIAASGAELAVWARQFTKPVPPAKPVQVGGAIAPVSTRVVRDQASQLRSRRN
jgi:hypothetical protein